MAQFYASIQGARGEATRLGNKSSGMRGHIRGWNVGGSVDMRWSNDMQRDVVAVNVTSGSNGRTLCGFEAFRSDDGSQIEVSVDPEFFAMIGDDSLERAFECEGFATRMKQLLFKHMDKIT